MRKADKARLTAALEGLPPQIQFLREPILAVARQDQDLLGCGEGDPVAVEAALRRHTAGGDVAESAAEAADALRAWLLQQPGPEGAWAGPAWFVEGFLRGCNFFGVAAADLQVPPARAVGLRCAEPSVPPGMKTKPYNGGMELGDRSVRMIVCELDEGAYRIRQEAFTSVPPPEWPRPPHLRDERQEFSRGGASGLRLTSRHAESGLAVMSQYLLERPLIIEVSMFARAKRGCDMSRYEGLLETIRRKG